MLTIFKKELKRTRKGLLIWCLIVGLTSYLGIIEYPILAPYTAMLGETLALIPKIAQLVFGVYNVNWGDTMGYYTVMYYWAGLIVFTHAIYTGVSIIAKEQRDKTAEFLFTMPVKRSEIVWAKVCVGLVNIFGVGFVTLVMSLLALLPMTSGAYDFILVLLTGVGMFLTQSVLLALGLLCSAIGKTYKSGVVFAMIVLLTSYSLMFFVQYIDMPWLNFLSPLCYFSASEIVVKGLSVWYILLATIVVIISLAYSKKIYDKKTMIG